MNALIGQAMITVKANAVAQAFPHLPAIYRPTPEGARADQVGTGIVFRVDGRHLLVTAKHVLVGHDGKEAPGEKAIVLGPGLKQFSDLADNRMCAPAGFDIAGFVLDGGDPYWGLSRSTLALAGLMPRMVTIAGYLARDFRRDMSSGVLMPAPYVYSNNAVAMAPGLTGMKYPRARNRNTDTGRREHNPVPAGMSGGGMFDTLELMAGRVRVVGLFTDYDRAKGTAFGENAAKIGALLSLM